MIVTEINCNLCIRDRNPTDVPLVNEVWFQVADERLPRISPARGKGSTRDAPVTQRDDPSSGEEPRTPSEEPSEPTQMEPHDIHESAQDVALSLAKARMHWKQLNCSRAVLLHSHEEGVVSPTKNTASLVAQPFQIPYEEDKGKEHDSILAKVADAPVFNRPDVDAQLETSLQSEAPALQSKEHSWLPASSVSPRLTSPSLQEHVPQGVPRVIQVDEHSITASQTQQDDPESTQVLVACNSSPSTGTVVHPQPISHMRKGRPSKIEVKPDTASVRSQSNTNTRVKGHLLLSRCRNLKSPKSASKSDRAICLMLFQAIALLVEYVGCCNSLCELFGTMCQLMFRYLSRLQSFNKNNSYSSDRHSTFAVQSPLSWQQ